MGRIINMTKETHEDGSFTMTPIEGVPNTLAEFVEQFGDQPSSGILRIDLDRYQETEKDIDPEKVGQPRILAGQTGPYIRLVSRAYRHFEGGQSYQTTLMGTIREVMQQGKPVLDLQPKLPSKKKAKAGSSSS